MKKLIFLISTFILSWIPFLVFADNDPFIQYLPEYMPQAPNAQAIARAIDIPVNYYTGIPNISIPLYNVQVGDLSVPIALSYQGGGIRPSQEASCVGLGWNLEAGGAITRTVKCADDFMEYYVSGCQYVYGYLQKQDWPDLSVWPDYNYYGSIGHQYYIPNVGIQNYQEYYLKVDSEPDIFFYNVPGNSGKFSFKKDTSIVYFDKSANVKINTAFGVSPRPYFYIIDAQGTAYCFETKERTRVYSALGGMNVNTTNTGVDVIYPASSTTNFSQVSDYTSTWYLTQMISATNDTINFEYADETLLMPLQESCRHDHRIQGASVYQDPDGPVYSKTKTEVDSKRLTKITWRGGHVDFEYGSARSDFPMASGLLDNPRPLTNIRVYNDNELLVCHWKMSYGYFNNNRTDIPESKRYLFKRLQLNSVENKLTQQEPYTFCYYDSVPMPVKNTKNLDYWGYYNGIEQGEDYYCPASNGIINSNKSANDHYGKIGILESMSHPTGGITKFHWETNKEGEIITLDESVGNDHDSYARGCLKTGKGELTKYEEVRKKTILLGEQTEIFLLLSSSYIGTQTCPSSGGQAFSIEKINDNGSHTSCYSWTASTVNDEIQQTVVLNPGIYEFKCCAMVDDVEYCMTFIDSRNKYTLKKQYENMIFSYKGNLISGIPETVSDYITLNQGGIVFLSYFSEPVESGITADYTQLTPFNILKRMANGTYISVYSWTISGYNLDENKTIHLDAGTYKIVCDAVVDNVAFSLSYSYGSIKYSPITIHSYEWGWKGNALLSYIEGVSNNPANLLEQEADTLTLTSPTRLYFDWFYEPTSNTIDSLDFINTRPFSIYKQNTNGTFNKMYSIPFTSFAEYDDLNRESSGLYLDAGTYIFKCEATTEDVIFYAEYVYKSDGIYSNSGSRRGGLRIGRIEGEKNVSYLYEGGKDLIRPCTFYKEDRLFFYQGNYETVVYEVRPSESVRPLSTLKNGNTIGYSKVVEVFADNSRTEYTYHNEEEELIDPDFPYSPSYTDWRNGLLLTKTVFNALGDTVSHKSNSYISWLTEPFYNAGFIETRPRHDIYYSYSAECPKLSHSTTTEYRSNGKYKTRQTFSYNNNLLCIEETKQAGVDIYHTIYKYANDFSDAVSQLMVDRNMVGIPLAQLSMRNSVFCDGIRTVYGKYNQLTDNGNTVICSNQTHTYDVFSEMCLPKYLLTLNTANLANEFSTCTFDTTIVFNSYTRFGKARELAYKGMPITYLWSYQGMYPIAEIKNATYSQFMGQYGAVSFDMSNAVYQDPEFLRDRIWQTCSALNNSSVSIALYTPLVGVTEMTDNRGVRHSYGYDAAGRLISDYQKSVISALNERIQSFSYGNNHVSSKAYPTISEQSCIETIQYYDAWGRPSICATQGVKQGGEFSYNMQTYDQLSRPFLSYVSVPSTSTTGGVINQSAFLSLSTSAFSGDQYGYARTSYDALGRTIETTTPGQAWETNNKKTTCQYLTNSNNEVKKYGVSGNSLVQSGYYTAEQLDCTMTTDPDGKTMKSYKDVFGNIVLERRAGNYDTYYVYDDCNRLRFVLPPQYQQEANLGYYAYQYEYDGRGRNTKKTLPGCSPTQYWYDNRDRLVKMQDGVLAQSGKYRVWNYDALDRVLSQAVEGPGNLHQDEVLYFYDNYSFTTNYSTLFPINISNNVYAYLNYGKGQLTGSWQKASDEETILSVICYDELGYLAKEMTLKPNRFLTISSFTNNLAGNVTEEAFSTYAPLGTGGSLVETVHGTIQNNYGYLHTNLLKSSVITIYDKNNNMSCDTIQHLSYDDFGNVATNNRSGSVADMTYGYDQMHGWLKSIKSGGAFEQTLYRETEGDTPCYNGNISAMTWKTDNSWLRRFDYAYNGMNWLTDAGFSYYSINGGGGLSPTLSLIPYVGVDHEDYTCQYYYDKNGNITGAYRQGLVDNLEYEYGLDYDTMDDYNVTYTGNQKNAVNGTGTGTPSYYGSSAFVDGTEDGTNEYAYDANGAMTKDLNKGITNISYDLLGNLKKITQTSNRSISYVYAADGSHLKTVHSKKVGSTYIKDSTEYCGNLIMKNGKPSMYMFAGGYYSFNNSLLNGCHYYIQDYLGSNRMVVNKNGTVEQKTHYYPYGGVIGGIDNNPTLQPYKFEGKEFDRTYGLDWYDIHARQYDPVVPSWHKLDPLAEKYYWISPYAYCANNPVNYADINGDSIFIDYEHQDEILSMINNIAQGIFGVTDNGFLFLSNGMKPSVDTDNYSNYYRDLLIEGIKSNNTISVSIASNINYKNKTYDLNELGQGITIFDNQQAHVYISGESHETESGSFCSPEMVLAHELAGHAIPAISTAYTHPFYDGFAVTAENIIRFEKGIPLRIWGKYERKDTALPFLTSPFGRLIINRHFNF